MTKTCPHCQKTFEITNSDLTFYEKVAPVINGKKYPAPAPTLCPDCRLRRRLAFRNERFLYNRKCDRTGQDIISMYPPSTPFPVYHQKEWFSEQWDERDYGTDFDFSKTFFEQYRELQSRVPRSALLILSSENSDYVNISGWLKNCYLVFATGYSEDSMYSKWLRWAKNCLDCILTIRSELCYESIRCENCYNVQFSRDSKNCHDSRFLYNCSNVSDSMFCANLRGKQYCIWNKQYSKEEYQKMVNSFDFGSHTFIEKAEQQFQAFLQTLPHKNLFIENSEEVSGDFIGDSKNAKSCYSIENCQDCSYIHDAQDLKDIIDCCYVADKVELCREILMAEELYNSMAVFGSDNASNLLYCDNCFNVSDSFGCIGLRYHRQYCILNKQYTKEEYQQLMPKVIDHMLSTGEWGEFFPAILSPFGYNETIAQEHFPLTRNEVINSSSNHVVETQNFASLHGGNEETNHGNNVGDIFNWNDYESPKPHVEKIIPAAKLPDNIKEIPDEILNWAIECEITKKPFRIIKPELKFYREQQLPIPRKHPDQRHRERLDLRNPRQLFDRNCMKCHKEIQSSYHPDRTEIVYCKECYLKEVY